MKKLLLAVVLLSSLVNAQEAKPTSGMKIELTVFEIVEAVCAKKPWTNDKKCIRKYIGCIDIDYNHGSEIKEAIFDCL